MGDTLIAINFPIVYLNEIIQILYYWSEYVQNMQLQDGLCLDYGFIM